MVNHDDPAINDRKFQDLVEFCVFDELSQINRAERNEKLNQLSVDVRSGLSGSCLQHMSRRIPEEILADLLGVKFSQLDTLYSRYLNKLEADSIYDMLLLWYELRIFFNDRLSLLIEWFETPLPAMSGSRPHDLVSSIYGRNKIRKCLQAMKFGEFS